MTPAQRNTRRRGARGKRRSWLGVIIVSGLVLFTATALAGSSLIYYVHGHYGLAGAIVGALAGAAQVIVAALRGIKATLEQAESTTTPS